MSDNQQDMQIPLLKRDAVITVQLGTGWIGRFQEGFTYMMEGHEEDLKKLEERKGNQENLTGWEQMVIASSILLQEIMTIAQNTDQLEYKPLSSMIPNSHPQDSGQSE
jgi:hypothetical protein